LQKHEISAALKNAVLQPVGRKTARACAKATDFCNRLRSSIFGKRYFLLNFPVETSDNIYYTG
jgi:hypothetical protein